MGQREITLVEEMTDRRKSKQQLCKSFHETRHLRRQSQGRPTMGEFLAGIPIWTDRHLLCLVQSYYKMLSEFQNINNDSN